MLPQRFEALLKTGHFHFALTSRLDDLTLFFVNNYTLGSNYGTYNYISSAQDWEKSWLSGEDEFCGRTGS
jgi:hypothetical protein